MALQNIKENLCILLNPWAKFDNQTNSVNLYKYFPMNNSRPGSQSPSKELVPWKC